MDSERFQIWLHRPSQLLWIVDPVTGLGVGPVADVEAREVLRRACTWAADGCSRGPFTWGFWHLRPAPHSLPGSLQDYTPFEPEWLPQG